MTCIVGLVDGGKVYLGADSMVSNGYTKSTLAEGKLWKKGELLFGGSGVVRPLQVLRHHLAIPPRNEGQAAQDYLVMLLMPAIRDVMKAHDMWEADKHRFEGSFLLGYRGTLYSVEGNLSVIELADGYGADGSGASFAEGSLFSTKGTEARKRLTLALEAAAYHELHVAPPFVIEWVKTA